jgi:tRNA (guanine26-N2/guanine27-N2)-dimethyltransferase
VTIADALSASGLRTIRYLKELTGVKQVVANDLLPAAHKLMQDNFDLNKLPVDKYTLSLQDANVLMREAFKQYGGFDVVDLDPYGSVVPFLDASMAAAKEGALLCITCTDTRVLCGPDLSKCYYFYGTVRAKVHDFNEVSTPSLRMP